MSVDKQRSGAAARAASAAAIAILVAAAIFFILYTPLYSSVTPKAGSWPFFYVYMLVYMPAVSLVLWVVTRLQDRLGTRNAPPREPGTAGAGSEAAR